VHRKTDNSCHKEEKMIAYTVSCEFPHRHFISLKGNFPTYGQNKILLQLAAWRPGRYELGNFSKNIRSWKALSLAGEHLKFTKLNKDLWEVDCRDQDMVQISYEYYGSELNAGSTYLDEEQLCMNPVNCFFYNPHALEENYQITFLLPADYQIATGMMHSGHHVLIAQDFDELDDCPLIASAGLHHLEYEVDDVKYNIWIQGEARLEEARLLNEFSAFTKASLRIFGQIPCDEYHFLFQFTPYFIRHGVEHRNSTVIAMGPGADFQNDVLFKDLLGISCHELFHTWNVKSIRPVEMMPYDFTKENYSRSGYVYEGVTTYYGDLLLWRSGCITDLEWFQIIEGHLQDYYSNHGRSNLSVADSSFDTWLDGYSPGIPWRKVSIYNEGFLLALAFDLMIIQETSGHKSLDMVMHRMYEDYGKRQVGYSSEDYQHLLEELMGQSMSEEFENYVHGNSDYTKLLERAFSNAGLVMNISPGGKWSDAFLGLSVDENAQRVSVQSVFPGSPADRAGLWNGDEIIAVNGIVPYKNFQLLFRMGEGPVTLDIVRKGKQRSVRMLADGQVWLKKYKMGRIEQLSIHQEKVYDKWKFA
jgi:predicted metalloprotease with PDZ domain